MLRVTRLLALPPALAVVASAGSASPSRRLPPWRSSVPDTVVVRLTNTLTYEPAIVRIKPGDTVLWRNGSLLVHTVTDDPALATLRGSAGVPSGAKPFNSGNLAPGASFTRTLTVPGRYHYFCIPHETARMRGLVVVSRASRPRDAR